MVAFITSGGLRFLSGHGNLRQEIGLVFLQLSLNVGNLVCLVQLLIDDFFGLLGLQIRCQLSDL